MNRVEAAESLIDFLVALTAGACVRWRRRGPGSDWPNQRRWPVDPERRAWMAAHLRACLGREHSACVIEVWADGEGDSSLFDWPASQEEFRFPGGTIPAAGLRPSENGVKDRDDAPAIPVKRPSKASRIQAVRIALILFSKQRRMTAPELLEALAEGGIEVSLSLVEATCSWRVSCGELTSGRDGHGRGYGLSRWEKRPEEGDDCGGDDEDE